MRDAGLSPAACNVYIRTLNAFLNWAHTEHGQPLLRMEKVKGPKGDRHLHARAGNTNLAVEGRNRSEPRLKALVLTTLETGLRVNELLTLTRSSVDLDNFMLRVKGKGDREKLVPISIELRKTLHRHLRTHKHEVVFSTRHSDTISQRSRFVPYAAPHVRDWIPGGGSLYYLQRIMGHSSITTTER